ncbi:tandem-95 repeat protein [Pseudoalteromonas xiamenensis]
MKLNQVTRILKGVGLVSAACTNFAVYADAINYAGQPDAAESSEVSLSVNSVTYLLDAGAASTYTAKNDLKITNGWGAYSSALSYTSPVATETGYVFYTSNNSNNFSLDSFVVMYAFDVGATHQLTIEGYDDSTSSPSVTATMDVPGGSTFSTFTMTKGTDYSGSGWDSIDRVVFKFQNKSNNYYDPRFAFSTVNVTPVTNSAPVVDLDSTSGSDNSSISFSEGGGAVNIAPNAAVTDADGDTIKTITVSLTNDQDGTAEGLSVSAAAQDALDGISGSSAISLQDTISITGATATASQVATFLQAITYNNTASTPNTTARTVTVVVNDGTASSTSRTSTISVSDVNAASSTAASFNTTTGTNLSPAIIFGSGDETLTIASTSHITGSTADGGSGTDTLSVPTGSDLTGFTSLTNFETLTPDSGASITLSESQHEAFTTINGSGTNQFTISSADGNGVLSGDADIETYALNAALTFTLGSASQNVTGGSSAITVKTGAVTATGTLTGSSSSDTLELASGANIAGATVSAFENLTVSSGASVTMTEAQHDSFSSISGAGTEQITISTATDGFTAASSIETYVLGAANTVTLSSASQNITGSSGNDTIDAGSLTITGVLNPANGTDTLSLSSGADISSATIANFENLTLASGASVTMKATHPSKFAGTITAPGNETITITGDGSFTTLSNIETFTVNDASSNSRTITLGAAGTSVSATSSTDAITFDVGSLTYTGTLTGENSTSDTLSMSSSANITSATLNNITNLTLASGASVSMTVSQHSAFSGTVTATGSETINISGDGSFTTLSNVENYSVADDSTNSRTITVSSTVSVTAGSATDAVTFALGGANYSGTLIGEASVVDTVTVSDGADVSHGSFLNVGTLSLLSGASVAIDSANLSDFSAFTGSGGSETLKLMDGGTFDFSSETVSAIETVAIGTNSAFTITLKDNFNSDGQAVAITNTTGSAITNALSINASAFSGDTLNISATDLNGNDTFVGGSGADTLRPGGGTDTLTGNGGNDNFIGSASNLNGDTITDLAIGDTITVTGVTGLSTSNVRFNGNSTLEVDTNATDFSSAEISLSLTNSPGSTLDFTVADSGSDTLITLIAYNEKPTFSNLNGAATFTEGGSTVVIDSDVVVADTELDALNSSNGNYNNASLTIVRNGGASSEDVFGNSGLLSTLTESGSFSYNSTEVGTVTTNSAGTLKLTFNSNATSALVDNVLQTITYSNTSENPSTSVALNYTFNDGTSDSAGTNQASVTITPVNDAPTDISLANSTVDQSDTAANYNIGALSTTDVDDSSFTYTLTTGSSANGSCTASTGNGSFQINGSNLEANAALSAGSYIVCIQTNDGDTTFQKSFTITVNDNVAPSAPSTPDLDAASDIGTSSTDNITNDTTPTFSGTAEAGATVELYSSLAGASAIGSATVSGSGNWQITSSTLSEGTHTITAKAKDSSNNVSSASAGLSVVIDTTVPSTPAITTPIEVDNKVNASEDDTVLIEGSGAESGATVTVKISDSGSGEVSTTTTADGLGNWTLTGKELNVSTFNNGDLTVTASQSDTAGNNSSAATKTIALDNVAPTGHSVNIDQTAITKTNETALSFTFASAEIGTTFTYKIKDGTSTISSSSSQTITSATQQVTGIDVTNLNEGTLTLEVIVTDSFGNDATLVSDTVNKSYIVAPTAVNDSFSTNEDTAKQFDLLVNDSDANGDMVASSAALKTQPTKGSISINSGVITYTPNKDVNGSDSFTYTVKDALSQESNVATVSITITAVNDVPTAKDLVINTDEDTPSAALNVRSEATDVEDTHPTGDLTIVTQPTKGSVAINQQNGTFVYTPNANTNGPDSFTYNIKDSEGGVSLNAKVDVNVGAINDAPVANADSKTFDEDTSTTLDILSNDTDVEDSAFNNSSITLQDVGQGAGVYSFATVTIASDGTLNIVPKANVNGQHTFTYSLKDSGSATSNAATVTLNITPINDAPVAVDNQAQLLEDGSFEVNVLGNDTDVDTGDSFNLSSLTVVKAPSQGSTQVTQTGAIVYTPNKDSNGTDTFTYTVEDSHGAVSNEATVTMTVTAVNDAPLATGQSLTLNEDNTLLITLAASDIDKDPLTYSIVTSTQNGSLTKQSDTTWLYSPSANYSGTDSFIFKANDGTVDSNQATLNLTINAVNDSPVANSDSVSVDEDTTLNVTLSGTDVEGSSLTYKIGTSPSHGSATISAGTLTYIPEANFSGADSLTVVANDGELDSSPATIQITVNAINDAPTITGTPSVTVNEDSAYQFTPSASDIDKDTLTFSITNKPNWLNFDSVTGTLSGTPLNEQVGSYTGIVISVSDGKASVSLPAFTLTVNNVNDAPVISGVPATTVKQDNNYSFTPTASDVDSPKLVFSIANKPAWASFDSNSGTLAGTPTRDDIGTYNGIVISVSDGPLSASLPSFAVQVLPVNSAPIAKDMQIALKEDGTTSFAALVSDIDKDPLGVQIVSQPSNGQVRAQGTTITYTPNVNFNGIDTFSYFASDGKLTSNTAVVGVSVSAVNDAPVANDDQFNLSINADNRYTLDVLANDSDVDGDTLTIIGAKSSLGSVAIVNGALELQTTGVINGPISLSYLIEDKAKARAKANVSLQLNSSNSGGPTITAPADLTVRATGLFTKVDLGVATAFDASGLPLPVSLVEGKTIFPPGSHLVYWQVTDSQGRTEFATQTVRVEPLISISKNSTVVEDSQNSFSVFLNGTSPSYPVEVAYSVSGTATSADHSLTDGVVVIDSGTQATVNYDVFADEIVEGTETIEVTLSSGLNLGAKSSTRIDIVEQNVAPALSLSVKQNGEERNLVTQQGGEVSLVANVVDVNPNDEVKLEWVVKNAPFVNQSGDPLQFVFDPINTAPGIYQIDAIASDNGSPSLTSKKSSFIEVIESLPQLGDQDSDGDLIPDSQEGVKDSDGDGIPDYLDAIEDCNVIQQRVTDPNQFLTEGSPGVCLRKGANVPQNQSGGVELFNSELTQDQAAQNVGGIFDFIANGLPNAGDVYDIVLPQREPIPMNPAYRKLRGGQWGDFVTDGQNQIYSALGEKGYCPPPGDSSWQAGLTPGHWCVQLSIQDGGPNDDDGVANGTIVDPGGIAVMNNGNAFPVVTADSASTRQGVAVVIDVLTNDTDEDNDALTITSADVDFGVVEIVDNKVRYTPPTNLLGTATILYGISDNQGGTASGEVKVEIKLNNPPTIQPDSAEVNIGQIAIVDVLVNDTDLEGDALILMDAIAQQGNVSVTEDQKIKYVPNGSFTGIDTITYYVQDELGAASSGTLTMTVNAENTNVNNQVESKSSGSTSIWMLVIGGLFGLLRRIRHKGFFLVPFVVSALSLLQSPQGYAAQNWMLGGGLTTAKATSISYPSNWQGQSSQVDDSAGGYYLSAGYTFMENWNAIFQYEDLGTASNNFILPASSGEEGLYAAPILGKSASLAVRYSLPVSTDFFVDVSAGVQKWKTDINATINGGTKLTKSFDGTDPLVSIGGSYKVSEHTSIRAQFQFEQRERNDVNTLMLGVERRF